LKHILITAALCLAVAGLASAQNISGPLSGTLGPGTFTVVGDCQVQAGQTLTIAPGTILQHSGPYKWDIYGTFTAVGTAADSIKFVRQFPNETCKWGGIRFNTGASASSSLSYCVIEFCKKGSTPYYQYGAGIYSNGVAISVSHSRISNCDNYWDGAAFYAQNAAVNLTSNLIVDNVASNGSNGGGIVLQGCNGATIAYNVVARNGATGT